MSIENLKDRIRLSWLQFYKQYEIWGVLLIVISLVFRGIGIFISYKFYSTISSFLYLATPGAELDYHATSMIGDFIGGVVGPILSFVGVLLFFLALRLQSKELGLQIKELAETREVFSTQQFENTFFNLLQTQQDIRINIEIEDKGILETLQSETESNSEELSFVLNKPVDVYKSSAFFDYLQKVMFGVSDKIDELLSSLNEFDKRTILSEVELDLRNQEIDNLIQVTGESDYKRLNTPENISKASYRYVYHLYTNQLGHYFRNLYHILSYLEENEIRERRSAAKSAIDSASLSSLDHKLYKIKRKYRKYSQFIQAQMSASELFLLFYNSLLFPKMKRLMHHYNFLENLNSDDLLYPSNDKLLYGEYELNGEKYFAINFKTKAELLKILS